MRYVTVPEPVTLVDNNDKPQKEYDPDAPPAKEGESAKLRDIAPITLHRLLMLFVINDEAAPEKPGDRPKPKIGLGYEGDKRCAKLDRLFDKVQPGDVVAVEDADWQAVKKILDEKLWQPKSIGMQLFPISEAWVEAKTEKPALKSLPAADVPAEPA